MQSTAGSKTTLASAQDQADEVRGLGSVASNLQLRSAAGQADEGRQLVMASQVKGVAASGVAGSGQPLPHLAAIQQSFGEHDVRGVSAHVGGAAAQASQTLGAEAYATGNSVAFRSAPSLHTAAHEAAHIVQQRQGVELPGGVGQPGDVYENRADAVADRVVQGRSAEDLLGSSQGSTSHSDAPVQGIFGAIKGFAKGMVDFVLNPKQTIYEARLALKGRQEEVLTGSHSISNRDVLLEQLAHAGAYGELDLSKLGPWGYQETGRVVDPESGFECVLYMPTSDALAGESVEAKIVQAIHGGPPQPVIAFAGTNPKEKRDIADDTHSAGVGAYQFASNIGKVKAVIAEAGGRVIFTGHSLGGALAQHGACNFPGSTIEVVTFQAPGISPEDVAKLEKYNAIAEDKVESTHYRAEGDIAHAAGEKLTGGTVYEFQSVGVGWAGDHLQFPLARLAAARGHLIEGIDPGEAHDKLVRIKKSDSDSVKGDLANKIAEWGRMAIVAPLAGHSDKEKYVEVWKGVQAMAQTGEYPIDRIYAVVAASDKLTKVQKIKMRDNVTSLWGAVLTQ